MAERLNAAVLKTVRWKHLTGSNPVSCANIDLWCNGKRNRLITDKVGVQIPSGQPAGGFHFLSTPGTTSEYGVPSALTKELFCVVWNQRGTGRREKLITSMKTCKPP